MRIPVLSSADRFGIRAQVKSKQSSLMLLPTSLTFVTCTAFFSLTQTHADKKCSVYTAIAFDMCQYTVMLMMAAVV